MFLWLIYVLALSQVFILHGLAAPLAMHETRNLFLEKNRDWVMLHPEFPRGQRMLRVAIGLSWLMGIMWLVKGMHMVLNDASQESGQILLLAGPVFSAVLLCVGYAVAAHGQVARNIPLPAKRRASLVRRTLRDYLHPAWAYLGYALVIAIVLAYLAAWWRGAVDTDLLVAHMTALAFALALQTSMLVYAVRRKEHPEDERSGPVRRKREVASNIAVLYLLVFIGAMRILQNVAGMSLFRDIVFFACISVLVQLLGIVGMRNVSFKPTL